MALAVVEHSEHPFAKGDLTSDGIQWSGEVDTTTAGVDVEVESVTIKPPALGALLEVEFGLSRSFTPDPNESWHHFPLVLDTPGGAGPRAIAQIPLAGQTRRVTIDTGAAVFSLGKRDGGLAAPGLSAPMFGRVLESGGGEHTAGGPVEVSVELSGPMRASVKVKGPHGGGLDHTSRFWFYAGQPGVRLFHTVENNTLCPVAEDGQLLCYHIGSGGVGGSEGSVHLTLEGSEEAVKKAFELVKTINPLVRSPGMDAKGGHHERAPLG